MIPNKNTFCLAPWYNIFVDSDKKLSPCCDSKKDIMKYNYSQLENYFFSDKLEQLRKDLINGIKNNNCTACWTKEKQKGNSLRLQFNKALGKPSKSSILNQIENPSIKNKKSFDLVLGNLCNLKCIMCKPRLSSQLLAEANLNPELKKWYSKDKCLENIRDYDIIKKGVINKFFNYLENHKDFITFE